jgi:ubiquinone/menaquinone biosynthesis C-methylase UbiE
MLRWQPFLLEHGKQKLMEAIAAGEFDKEKKVSGSPVAEKELRKVRRIMTKVGWQRYLKGCKTSSNEPDAVAIAERLSQIQSGVLVDFGCGGGFTTERVLQEIQPSACCVPIDIAFEGAKIADRRAELLGKGNRCLGMCADLRQLPFADGTLAATYTRYGFNHIHHYVDALKEAYRATKKNGRLVVVDDKSSRWLRRVPGFRGVNPEEKIEILRQLGLYASGQDFVEDVKRVGFDVLTVHDLQMPKRYPKVIVEAGKA